MDAITKLAYAAAERHAEMEKEARLAAAGRTLSNGYKGAGNLLSKGYKGAKGLMEAAFTRPAKFGEGDSLARTHPYLAQGPSLANGWRDVRTFSPARAAASTAATSAGTAGVGYGGYGVQQYRSTANGGYNAGAPEETPGWRRQRRALGQQSFLGDLFRNPGRTLAEGFGHGSDGPKFYMKENEGKVLRRITDPITGKTREVRSYPEQERVYSPDGEAKRLANLKTQEEAKKADKNWADWSGEEQPKELGRRAAYQGKQGPGPLKTDYSMYNYGI